MRPLRIALAACLLLAAPAAADHYEFTGTLSIPDGSPRFLPLGVGVSGAGVGSSSVIPNQITDVHATSGFFGKHTTSFGATGGFTQIVFLRDVGEGNFGQTVPGGLRGQMPVRGRAWQLVNGSAYAAFELTSGGVDGLGLGGTFAAISGPTPSVRFGSWTTGTAQETSVITQSNPALGSYAFGTVSAMGSDARTPSGMGQIRFVTPVRTVSGLAPGQRGAVVALTLSFAPEPARALMLAAGCAALAAVGLRRRRA